MKAQSFTDMCQCEQQAERSMEDREQGGKSPSTHMTGL